MEINIGQKRQAMNGISSRKGEIPSGATIISANLKKKSVTIDKDGNQIDLATKRIIKLKGND